MSARRTLDGCCGAQAAKDEEVPDHSSELNRLNRIKGQLDGIGRMIEGRKYCPDILTQTAAVKAAMSALEASILEKHLNACVRDAFSSRRGKIENTIEELLDIFKRASK